MIALGLIPTIFMVSCGVTKLNVSTEGFTHEGQNIYYHGELVAELSAVEVAYDDGKIVREVTFLVTDAKYNELAIPIIAFMREHNSETEVEVELRMKQ
jgi:hypothetical protein